MLCSIVVIVRIFITFWTNICVCISDDSLGLDMDIVGKTNVKYTELTVMVSGMGKNTCLTLLVLNDMLLKYLIS